MSENWWETEANSSNQDLASWYREWYPWWQQYQGYYRQNRPEEYTRLSRWFEDAARELGPAASWSGQDLSVPGPSAPVAAGLPSLPERYQPASNFVPPATPEPENFWDWMWSGVKRRVGEAWEAPTSRETPEHLTFVEALAQGRQELAGEEGLDRVWGALKLAPGILAGRIGQGLDELLGEGPVGTGARQVFGAGIQALQEPANVLEQMTGAAAIGLRPESEGLEVSEWAPLTERTWSLAWQQAQERLGIRDEAELQPGQETTAAWGRDVLGQALEDISAGRRTADEIVHEEEIPLMEFVGQFAGDPLNLIDVFQIRRAKQLNAAIDGAEAAYGMRLAEVASQAGNAPAGKRLRQLWGSAAEALESVNPLALTAESQVQQDAARAYAVVRNLVEDAGSTKAAKERLRMWLDNPAEAANRFGDFLASEEGLRAAEHVREVNLDQLVTAIDGRPFSAPALAREIDLELRPLREAALGVKDPKGYRAFARSFKRYASELYMTGNPGYWVRNALNNLGTLGYDGILTLDSPKHLDDYLGRLGLIPERVAGITGAPASPLPGLPGKLSDKFKDLLGRAGVNEEAFFKRGFSSAVRKTMDRVWHSGARLPELPADLAARLPAEVVADLQAAARTGLNGEEIAKATEAMLAAETPGQALQFVMRYLPDEQLGDLSAGMLDHLREEVMRATSLEEAEAAVDAAMDAVVSHGNDAFRASAFDPTQARAVWTETELSELKAAFVSGMLEDARRFGLDEAQAADTVASTVRMLESQEARMGQAANRMMQRAGQLQRSEGLQIAYRANRQREQVLARTRQAVDAARRQAWDAYGALTGKGAARRAEADAIWQRYFSTASREWNTAFNDGANILEQAYVDLERLAQGVPFEQIGGLDARAILEERLQRQAQIRGQALGDVNAAESFDERLAIYRARSDEAQGLAWEAASARPDQEALDILDSADRTARRLARQWSAERDYLRNQFLSRRAEAVAALEEAKTISEELRRKTNVERFHLELHYYQAQEALAKERFRQMRQVWEVAEHELRGAPAQTRVERLLALDLQKTTGVTPEEAARLAGERMGVGGLPGGELGARTEAVRNREIETLLNLSAPGAAKHPDLVDLLDVSEQRSLAALESIREGLRSDWPRWQARQADAGLMRDVQAWVDRDVLPALRDARLVAVQAAEEMTNFALLDYSKQNKLDEFLSLIFPYHFWYSRSGANWLRRLRDNPSRLANYLRYKALMVQLNEERGLRPRFEGKWKLPVPESVRDRLGLEWMSPALYFDPAQYLFPFGTFDRTDFGDDDQVNSALAQAYRDMKVFMPQPYAYLQIPLQLGEVAGMEERESFRDILPQTAPLRGVTAMLGIGGAEGLDIEKPLRAMFGLPSQEQWQPYRIRRMLASMAADEPETSLTALRAQELQDRVEAQEIPLAVALGDEDDERLMDLVEEMNWSTSELAAAQVMLREAVHRSAVELGIRTVTSFHAGLGMTPVAAGEEKQLALQREGGELLWSAENPEGSMAAYQEWKAQHPEVAPRQKQYRELPDVEPGGRVTITPRQSLSPGAQANYNQLKAAKDAIYERYDQAIDALLRKDPANWDGYQALQDQRDQEIAAAEAQFPVPPRPPDEPVPAGKLPEGYYGQSPAEYADDVAEDEARSANAGRPRAEAFAGGDGQVDWQAYFQAQDQWRAQLPETTPALQAVQALGGQYAGMTLLEIVDAYAQRYDSPLEALARTYHDLVGDAGGEYVRLKESLGSKEAYERTLAAWYERDVPAEELIDEVLARYQGKGWTKAELAKAYAGLVFLAQADEEGGGQAGVVRTGGQASRAGGTKAAAGSMWTPGTDAYEEAAARVAAEGWRAVYGLPDFEYRPRRGRGDRTYSRFVPEGWQYRRYVYGGPRFSRV